MMLFMVYMSVGPPAVGHELDFGNSLSGGYFGLLT